MLRAIIIDDEQKGINSIKLLIQKFVNDVKIVAETTEAVNGIDLIENYQPDVVFLDINMPHLNGFELLNQLKFRDFNLIFTTAHEEHALQAIKNNALDYLLKPIDLEDLQLALDKARNKTFKHGNQLSTLLQAFQESKKSLLHKVAINSKDSVDYFDHKQIIYFEADSNYTKIHLDGGKQITSPKTLKEFEKLMCEDESKFMRIHQSYIVNLQHITKYIKEDNGKIVMKDGSLLPISKNKRVDFLNWLKLS